MLVVVELPELEDEEEELLDELLELDEDVMQSAKPKQLAEFVGQQPLGQQRVPH